MSSCYSFIKLNTDKPKITENGFLIAKVTATKTGVFPYIEQNGKIRRELRLPEEVFKKDSMESLANISFTDMHPFEAVHAFNSSKYTKGLTGNVVKQNNDLLETELTVFDGQTIENIINGKIEVSAGYKRDLEYKSGVYNGQSYDCIQRNIRYNHLACVDKGRANFGDELRRVKINLDSIEDISFEVLETVDKQNKGEMTVKLVLDGLEIECGDANLALAVQNKINKDSVKFAELKNLNNELKKQNDIIRAEKDAITLNLDSINKQFEELKKTPKLDDKLIFDKANELLEVKTFITKALPKLNIDGLSADEMRQQFVSEKFGNEHVKDKSIEYIKASFDAFKKMNAISNTDAETKGIVNHFQNSSTNSFVNSREKFRQKFSLVKNDEN